MSLPMFFESVTGISNADFDDSHQYEFGFTSRMVQIHFKFGTGPIKYSFNGDTVHGELNNTPGAIQTQILEPYRANRIWLAGGDGTEIVEVTAIPGV